MNVIISNKQQALLADLQIEVIKTMNGIYKANEIVDTFGNFFFGRMILDITAVEDYYDIKNLQLIAISLPIEKIIFLLPDEEKTRDPKFISRLISIGVYNFSYDLDSVRYLLQNPNSYRDVAHMHQIEDQVIVEKKVEVPVTKEVIIEKEVPTMTSAVMPQYQQPKPVSSVILGIKNLTSGAGSTTLSYLIGKELQKRNIPSIVIEAGKNDFNYFNDKELISVSYEQLPSVLLKYRNFQVIIVDLNGYSDTSICSDVIYLLEPSIIKLNRLMLEDRGIFSRLRGKKIVLSKTLLTENDIKALEYEAKTEFFDVIPPINDRTQDIGEVVELLHNLDII